MTTRNAIRHGLRLVAGVMVALLMWTATLASASASTEAIDRIVAQVNDQIITQYELEEAAEPYLLMQRQNPAVLHDDDQRTEVLEEVLEDMINRILIEEQAQELGLEVTDEQVDEWMRMTAQQQNLTPDQFRQLIVREGIDYEEYRQIVRDNLLRMQLMQARGQTGTSVADAEVEQAYREKFGTAPDEPERRLEMRHILLVPDQLPGGEQEAVERLEEMRRQIEHGEKSFEELARTESQGPGADDGGNIGTFGRGELAPSFEEAAFEQEVGEVSEPVKTEFGYHLIEVLRSEEEAGAEVEERKEQIRAMLKERAMERQLESYLERVRERAFVDVRF